MGKSTTWVLAVLAVAGGCGGSDDGPSARPGGSSSDTGRVTGTGDGGSGSPATGLSSGETTSSTADATSTAVTSDFATTSAGGQTSDGSGSESVGAEDCANALLCDDFEVYAVGADPGAPWVVSTSMATVAVDDSKAYSGTQSVRFVTEAGAGAYRRAFMSIEGAPVFPAAADEVWGRMMFWLAQAPTGAVHWTNIQGEGDVEGRGFRGVYRYGGMFDARMMANYETFGASTDCWQNSSTDIPTATWTCLEWHFVRATNTMELYLDGEPVEDLTVVGQGQGCGGHDTGDRWYAPVFDTMRVGWEHYQMSVAHELWIDDVAMDGVRVGCPPG